jgi:hypothetical protein
LNSLKEVIMKGNLALLSMAALLAAAAAFAQPPAAPGYDVSMETKLAGTVESVTEIPGGHRGAGLHVTLAVGKDKWDVHLGPQNFARSIGLEPAKGDSWDVTGSADGKQKIVVAREVRKGDKTYRLRDAQGFPLWSHGRR